VGHVSALHIPVVPAHDHSRGERPSITDNPVPVTELQRRVDGYSREVATTETDRIRNLVRLPEAVHRLRSAADGAP
jgi:hypothetical protein